MKLRARDKLGHRLAEAQAMLDSGQSVLAVAHTIGVSTQAVYHAIATGRLTRATVRT